MPKKIPVPEDFPPHVTVVISYPGGNETPPPTTSTAAPSNILILLHGLGDSATTFASFGRALNLPETICVTVQAPSPLPSGLVDQEGYHWGNDVIFEGDELAMDAGGFDRSAGQYLARDVVTETLVKKCGYMPREIMMLGLGQGGMAALVAARELGSHPPPVPDSAVTVSTSSSSSSKEPIDCRPGNDASSLGGVVSFGAPYPLSASTVGPKNRTPVLLLAGRDDGHTAVSDTAVRRTKDVFEFVELHRWPRRGDGLPRNRDEVLPVMQFFARRLRSRLGVPEGSIELT